MKVFHNEHGQLVYRASNGRLAIYWTSAMIEKMKRDYPFMLSQELADEMGLSVVMIRQKARDMGLTKDACWMRAKRQSILKENFVGIKRVRHGGGRIENYIFRETPEQKKARLDKTRATMRSHPELEVARRLNIRKAFREKTPEEKEAFRQKMRELRLKALANGAAEKARETIGRRTEAEKRMIVMKANATKQRKKGQGL